MCERERHCRKSDEEEEDGQEGCNLGDDCKVVSKFCSPATFSAEKKSDFCESVSDFIASEKFKAMVITTNRFKVQ